MQSQTLINWAKFKFASYYGGFSQRQLHINCKYEFSPDKIMIRVNSEEVDFVTVILD